MHVGYFGTMIISVFFINMYQNGPGALAIVLALEVGQSKATKKNKHSTGWSNILH